MTALQWSRSFLERFLAGRHRRSRGREAGATAIEYAMIAGLISIVAIVGMNLIGVDLVSYFDKVANAFP